VGVLRELLGVLGLLGVVEHLGRLHCLVPEASPKKHLLLEYPLHTMNTSVVGIQI